MKKNEGGWQAFTDGGTAPGWMTAARIVMVLALSATIPAILGIEHGNRLVWTVCIAALPFFWMTFGYHLWRRICPLAVASQIGRLVGRPGARKMGDWMGTHYLLVQLAIMIVALSLRLVATNGSDVWLAGFLGAVIACAIVTSFVYAGKTWCNFLCPVGMVEKIYTEPARRALPPRDVSSQCSPCVACKKHCPDIDLEQGYWKEAGGTPRRIAYFAWPGIVAAFYVYYYLVSGSWTYYFSGAWAYERDLPAKALGPGFTFAPAIPRVVAAPLTLLAFGAASFFVFAVTEKLVLAARMRSVPADASDEARAGERARVRHGMLAFCGLIAFNAFYCFAGQPSLQRLPSWIVTAWGLLVVLSSTAIFMRRVGRREDGYVQEKFGQKILKKWEWGDAPPSDNLKDIYLLHTERTKQRESRLRAYKETLREMVADGLLSKGELAILDSLRAQLGVSDKDHAKILGELSAEDRKLFDPAYQGSVEQRIAREQYLHELDHVARLVAAAETAHNAGESESASLSLLRHLAQKRAHDHIVHALGVLAVMTKRPEVEQVRDAVKARRGIDPAVLAPLAGVDPALREPLTALVARLAKADAAALTAAPILAIAADSSRHLRAAAAVLLSRFDEDGARSTLQALLDDVEPIVREAAVRAMGAKSRLTRDLLSKVLGDSDARVRQAAVRAVSGGTSSELPAIEPAVLAQTIKGAGKPGVYATLDANAAMASLTTIEKMMLLRQVPIFADLDADDLEELAAVVEERRIEAGKDLFREGDVGDAVYLIVKGTVRVFVGGGDHPERTLNEEGPGACIGEMAVLDAAPRSATARATERVRALRVPGEGFKRVMSERPEMSEAIVSELVRRMRGMMHAASRPKSDRDATP